MAAAVVALVLAAAVLWPPVWQAVCKRALAAWARQHDGVISVGRMQGRLGGTLHLYDVTWNPRGAVADRSEGNASLRIARVDLAFAWGALLDKNQNASWLQQVTLARLDGQYDLGSIAPRPDKDKRRQRSWFGLHWPRLKPSSFVIQGDHLELKRNRWQISLEDFQFSCARAAAGSATARVLKVKGPGFANSFYQPQARTAWRGTRLGILELALGPQSTLVSATIDGADLERQRLQWEAKLLTAGGEVRGQGSISFVQPRLALEVAGSLRHLAVAPIAALVGFGGPVGGTIEQGNFSFRGDPEDWRGAETWLSLQSNDLRWGRRAWDQLDLRAMILHQRIKVYRLELQQARNRLSLTGECPLMVPDVGATQHWWDGGFACNVDARLDDLRALAGLFHGPVPTVSGRMSINGALEAAPSHRGIEGYLNVEGSGLEVRGAPVDYLHYTLIFKDGELRVADLQATHQDDYLAGRGTFQLVGTARYQGEVRVSVNNPFIYLPAWNGIVPLRLERPDGLNDITPLRFVGIFYGPDRSGEVSFEPFNDYLSSPGLSPIPETSWWGEH